MRKRETILLAALGVAVVVAIIIFLAAAPPPPAEISEPAAKVQLTVVDVQAAFTSTRAVLESNKFATLKTYGKIPVVVEPFELGNKDPLNPSR